ncbi:MAG: DUF1206 domain-containing protein [Alphaproteobacteria bacterium]|nr:DUF1206 domain-containing protein [Alphaproteobacteria bacterium]
MHRSSQSTPSRDERTTLTIMARIGFAARGLVYLLVAAFAAAAALGLGQQPHGIVDAIQAVTHNQLQVLVAGSIGTGLACLAAYFAIAGLRQCCRGRGTRSWLFGAGMLGDALIYAAVMISTLSITIGWHPDGEREAHSWTAWLLVQPFGRGLVGFVGLVILACGIGVIVWFMTADIDDDLDLPESQKRAIEPIGRYGLAGRGAAISLVGIYWMAAAIQGQPAKAHELGGALEAVQQHSKGWLLLLFLGIALAASAVFDFVEALYHSPQRLANVDSKGPR